MLKCPKLVYTITENNKFAIGGSGPEAKQFLTMVGNHTNEKAARYLNEPSADFAYIEISSKALAQTLPCIYLSHHTLKRGKLCRGVYERAKLWCKKVISNRLSREDFLSYLQSDFVEYKFPAETHYD